MPDTSAEFESFPKPEFDWDEHNINHIAEHDVSPEEAEQVLLGDSLEIDFDVANGEERWTYIGETSAARILTVVFTTRSERMRVITAFSPSPLRMRIYLQWRASNHDRDEIHEK